MNKESIEIPGYQGRAVRMNAGTIFRIVDVEGCQIADMFVLSAVDVEEHFSPAVTRLVISRLVVRPGDCLYSNRRNALLTFLDDTSPGQHDMTFAPCDPEFYLDLAGDREHPNCRDNYLQALGAIDLARSSVPDPINLFQNTVPGADGDYIVGKTSSKAGEYAEFRAETDVIIVVTACSVDVSIDGVQPNGGKSTAVRLDIAGMGEGQPV